MQEHTLRFGKARSHFGEATWLLEAASGAAGIATRLLLKATAKEWLPAPQKSGLHLESGTPLGNVANPRGPADECR